MIVFCHAGNRKFVDGAGPFVMRARPWARRVGLIGMWLLLAAGILASLGVGVAELLQRQQWAQMEATLKTIDAQVIGCADATNPVPYFRYTAEGKVYNHYPPETRADICDNRTWQVTYVEGDPDAWAVAPDSPLPPFVDKIDVIWIAVGPLLLIMAGVYWLLARMQDRRAIKVKRLLADGALIGAELLSRKLYQGDTGGPSLSIKYRINLPEGRVVDAKQSFVFSNFTEKTLPPVGSKILVLRVDDSIQEVL